MCCSSSSLSASPKQLLLIRRSISSDLERRAAVQRLHQPIGPAAVMACEQLIADIDQRVAHITAQVALGADREEVIAEQYQALLAVLSMLHRVDLDTVSRVSKHLVAVDTFSRPQLLAFSASLRAGAATRLDQPSNRPMQSNKALEHFLLQSDWDRLHELGKQPKQGSVQLEEIVAARMHRTGLVCPDADTLKRASAIVQAASGKQATTADKRGYVHEVKRILKKLDKHIPWPFEYIRDYPRSPFELPEEVLDHAYGKERPANMPQDIDGNGFKLIVASTPYKKLKPSRLYQTPDEDKTPNQGATQPVNAVVPFQVVSPPSTHQPAAMNAGPFAALMHAFMHGMQHMGSQNTFGSFTSRHSGAASPPVQPESDIPLIDPENSGDDDELAKIEADFATAKKAAAAKAAATPKAKAKAATAKAKAAKAKAKAAALEAKATATALKAKEKAAAGKAKGKSVAPKAKGKAAVPTAKGGAAAPPVKAASAAEAAAKAGAKPSGKFNISTWITENITRAAATAEPTRRNFISRIHHRAERAVYLSGVGVPKPIVKKARDAAGGLHDSVHKKHK